MGKGRMRISYELLVELLALPTGTRILETRDVEDFTMNAERDTLEIKLSCPDLPEVPEGEIIRLYAPQYSNTWHPAYTETQFDQWV